MLFFLSPDDIVSLRTMPRISIFLQNKLITTIKPGFDNRLQDRININSLAHLAVSVARNLVKMNQRLEIITNSRLAMKSLFVFLRWLSFLLNTILAMPHA